MNKILSVSQLNNYVKSVFDDELMLQNITVEGEVFECKFSGGNTYLTLKENEYVLPCVKFGGKLEFGVGDKIHVTGSMRFYPRGGRTTFVVSYATSVGKGALLVKFNELKDRLSKEGVFDNKKKLPVLIKRLALITSSEGAVIHDFLEVLSRGGCGYIDIDLFNVKVQGTGAENDIAGALKMTFGRGYDVVVVARGGGSGQDLSCFNTEAVARAVSSCAFPVISAIGHEIDYTLCDFASSVRAGTPSIAAELIVRNNETFVSEVASCLIRLRSGAERLISGANGRAKMLSMQLLMGCERNSAKVSGAAIEHINRQYAVLQSESARIRAKVESSLSALYLGAKNRLDKCQDELKFSSALLDSKSPLKILSGGYAKVTKGGAEVNNASEVDVGDDIKVIMSGGSILARVTDKE